ncbi:MAG: translocation/assembly module TamB, partial [Bacteroidetes bacterium]|nr:translocation/assembly module TamB [Bacteroidota bacterium]
PYEATADIKAVYKLRTSLKPLRPQGETGLNIDTTNKRIPVECVIAMRENLFNPQIEFGVEFPTLDENSQKYYKNAVNTDLNQQVFSLLVINNFVVPSNLRGADAITGGSGFGVGANSTELLSNQLSNWLSQISNDFDIGVNYRAGDEINSDELEVALSTQLFNDRVSIDGNFGVAGSAQQNASNIIGDVNVEVKLTEEGRFRVRAFNKTNTSNDLITKNAPYTQGVGIFYRKEFDYIFKKK